MFCKRFGTPRGLPKTAKLFFRAHETACRYEPLPELDRTAENCGVGGGVLVSGRKVNAPDAEVKAYAAQHDYVVLTHDLDFSEILAATHGEKPSVVQIRTEDVRPRVIGSQVIAALRHMQSELQAGALLTIDRRRTRVRLLPLISKE